jgi:hypothetical protein
LGELLIGRFGAVNGVPISFGVAPAFLELGIRLGDFKARAGHRAFLSFSLAGRMETMEMASVPRRLKTTVTAKPAMLPVAMKRLARAGKIVAVAKNSISMSAKSIPCFEMLARRFRSSHVIFTGIFVSQ